MVTKRGADAAVLVPVNDWQRLQLKVRPTLKDLLLAEMPRGDFLVPTRGRRQRRKTTPLD